MTTTRCLGSRMARWVRAGIGVSLWGGVLAAVAAGADPSPETSPPTRKLALLVGINDYADPRIPDLRGAVNDVREMKRTLETVYGFPPEQVTVLTDAAATRDAILTAFQEKLIAPADAQTVVVFHYSGHGSHEPDAPGTAGDEPDRTDETIVPHDSGRFEPHKNQDITDDELGELFESLRAKTAYITYIFDSCHSGDATKDIEQPRELAPDTRPIRGRDTLTRGARGDGPRDYAQISGCRPSERSYEFTTYEGERFGALTYHLLQAIQAPAPEGTPLTYRDVMDRVAQQVTAKRPNQHPQAEGTGLDRQLFGIQRSVSQPYLLVHRVAGDRVELTAGRVHGLTPGSLLDVFPPGTKDFTDRERVVAELKLVEVQPHQSKAELVKRVEGRGIEPASRAVVRVRQFENAPFRLFLDEAPAGSESVLRSLRTALSAPDFPVQVRLSDREEAPSLVVRRLAADPQRPAFPNRFAFLTGDGSELSAVPANDPEVVEKLAEGVRKWSNWFSTLELTNPEGRPLARLQITPPEGKEKLTEGDQIQMTVENLTGDPIYFALLDLSSDASVTLIVARGQNQALPPRDQWSFTTEAYVPDNSPHPSVTDHIKLIATQQPIDLSFLQQEGVRNVDDVQRDLGALGNLMAARLIGTKQIRPYQVESNQWSTAVKTMEVIRRPRNP